MNELYFNNNMIQLISEIIRLNNFDTKVKDIFGYSDNDTDLDICISNLFEILTNLLKIDSIDLDNIFDIVFDDDNTVNSSEGIYKEILKIMNDEN